MAMAPRKLPFNFMALLLGFAAIFALLPLAQYSPIWGWCIKGTFIAINVLSVYAVAEKKIHFIIAILLAIPSIAIQGIDSLDNSLLAQSLRYIFSIALYGYVSFLLLRNIFKSSVINNNIIYEAICVYMLIGIIWGSGFTVLEIVTPGSISGLPLAQPNLSVYEIAGFHIQSLFYYSYITLTTLGYGNIAPVSPAANALAASEAIVGQLYITILIARLVGLHVLQNNDKGN